MIPLQIRPKCCFVFARSLDADRLIREHLFSGQGDSPFQIALLPLSLCLVGADVQLIRSRNCRTPLKATMLADKPITAKRVIAC